MVNVSLWKYQYLEFQFSVAGLVPVIANHVKWLEDNEISFKDITHVFYKGSLFRNYPVLSYHSTSIF